ncbi:MAG: ATP-dependent helicase, partial [Pirellulaceae bacterium]|nr:ATP-dependent helicase [Pirellulaceae bacterium]
MELVLTPAGHLLLEAVSTDAADTKAAGGEASRDERFDRVVKAFAQDRSRGLFSLAAENLRDAPTPAFHYWRDFAAKYLAELCRTPETADARIEPIVPPNDSELGFMVLGAPPMRGAEYLTISVLQSLWTDLDNWARGEIASRDDGLSGFLKHHAPLWHQVGRVCFHLAENRRDPDYPFAFLATYAPSIAGSGRVQYQPLGNALREYAGAKNKKALIKLLSPVEMASQESPLVKDLLESGDLYQPLAWTPAEAYRLLKEIPLLEKSGILVRLPDWWKKRSRPRVAVTVGEKRRSAIGTDGLLDFSVDLALGDERLTESEWRELMAGGEGLVLLRGQWVEVDRDKLAQALEHWKSLEQTAADGLSFAEGMRLLAGAPMELGGDNLPEQESQWSFVNAGQWLREVLDSLRGPERLVRVAPGGDFKATLREYQEVGVNWLWFLSRLGLGACLADDMG